MPRAIRNLLIVLLAVTILVPLAAVIYVERGWAEGPLRRLVIMQIDKATGGRTEIGAVHFRLRGLRAELDDFTLHGREQPGTPVLFHADKILVQAKLLSFWGHRLALREVVVDHPDVTLQIAANGENNLPIPPVHKTKRPWREQLFDLQIGHVELSDGHVEYRNQRIPLDVRGNDFHFLMIYDASAAGNDFYAGQLAVSQTEIRLRQDPPFTADAQARFTLGRDSFSLDELRLDVGQSQFQVRAELASFLHPAWTFHARVRLALDDMGQIFRKPTIPTGIVNLSGEGQYADGQYTADGHYEARRVGTKFQWFHASDMQSSGRFAATQDNVVLPDFSARALGGSLSGRVQLIYKDLVFHTQTRIRGVSLAAALKAVDNPSLPVRTLHWNGTVAIDSANDWDADFQHLRIRGQSTWTPAAVLTPSDVPAAASFSFDYVHDKREMTLTNSTISTPNSVLKVAGTLGKYDSALETELTAQHLLDWDDFINYLRGPDSPPVRVAGQAHWRGRILGPIGGPSFVGHVDAEHAQYGNLDWDSLTGDLDYSPDGLQLKNTHAVTGDSAMDMNLSLSFDGDWHFLPQSPWQLDAHLNRTPIEGLQEFFHTSYPVQALVTGEFHGGGTRAEPELSGDFRADKIVARAIHLEELKARLDLEPGKVCLQHVHLASAGGEVTGGLCYDIAQRAMDFSVDGAGISLAQLFPEPGGRFAPNGTLQFHGHGHGSVLTPVGEGQLRIHGLSFGAEKEGDLAAQVTSDGTTLHATLASTVQGELNGQLAIGLSGDYPVQGKVNAHQVDLDPLIESALHLAEITGHSSVDGVFTISGVLRNLRMLTVDADVSRLSLDYETVSLENVGPLRLTYSGQRVSLGQVSLHGPNSDFRVSGQADFTGDKALNIRVDGTVNLHLLEGFVPALNAQGAAVVSAGFGGTFSRPQITGQIRVSDVTGEYGEFPAGLTHVSGTFTFDRQQLIFENVKARSGGGDLLLSGSVGYSIRPVRFDVSTTATNVRIRYPAGLSWLGSATIRLAGTSQYGLLSGNVTADRLLVSSSDQLAGMLATNPAGTTFVASSSTFLRNLQLDISAQAGPGARMQWSGARLDIEGGVRVRGTWDHPVILGDVQMLQGDLVFQGTKYQINRGDINFANPFRLDPNLNVEATTTIQQYVITISFSGPMSHLSLAYRSDPPLPTSDVIALLALGSTGEQTGLRSAGGQQSQNYGATALLSAAISNQLGGRIEQLFGISSFRVSPFLAGTTEQNAAARVTIQQQVTRQLTVTYSTNAQSNQQQAVQLEYALSPKVSLVALRDINGIYSVSVKFTKRLK